MGVRLVALAPGHAAALRAIRAEPAVERWWDPLEDDFPWEEPEATRFAVVAGGEEVVGMVQWSEQLEPKYRSATLDVFLATAHQGRGVGTEAVRLALAELTGRLGHHRVTIDPAVDNLAAVRCYEKAGFRRVGVLHLAERDADGRGWHDALMMEWVREP